MTKEEINKLLADTKVYVAGKSEELQKKLFSFGHKWATGEAEVDCTEAPFLYISRNHCITKGRDMCIFTEHGYREISAEEILSLKITESDYRPFKDIEECWNEMLKHQPIGLIKCKNEDVWTTLINVGKDKDYQLIFNMFTFADGTPFGIKED